MNTHFQKNQHAESFFGLARKPLEEERKRIIENIVIAEGLKIEESEKKELLDRLWSKRREIERMIENI